MTNPTNATPTGARTILHLSASARGDESATDLLARELLSVIAEDATVVTRRLTAAVPLLTIDAATELATPPELRSAGARPILEVADELIAELTASDAIVIGLPIYNFGPPAALKAWADLVARAGTTFGYTEQGPKGLLDDRPVYVVVASGGTPVGSELDHGTAWLRQFLGFLGITDVRIVAAEGLAIDPDAGLGSARAAIAALASAA